MEFQAYPTSQPRLFAKDITMSTFDDIPSFEEAFNSDSLRKFYQQQETGLSSCCESPDHEDSAFEEVETQASPLLRYLNKFNQDTPLPVLQSAINLNQIFDSAEMSGETFPESFLQKDSYEMTHLKIFEDSSKQQMEKAEGKKVIEMKGKLSMTMCNGNFTFKGMANPQVVQSANIKGQDETSNFERLLQNKKIFKIQKDVKPKCSTKLKAQAKNKASNNIVKLPFTITQSPSKEVTSISGFLNMK